MKTPGKIAGWNNFFPSDAGLDTMWSKKKNNVSQYPDNRIGSLFTLNPPPMFFLEQLECVFPSYAIYVF